MNAGSTEDTTGLSCGVLILKEEKRIHHDSSGLNNTA
jgi:hypothetical protein